MVVSFLVVDGSSRFKFWDGGFVYFVSIFVDSDIEVKVK